MIDQAVINWAIGCIGALLGIFLKTVLESVKDLQRADGELTKRISSIEVLVVGTYVKREDFDRMISELFRKLDKIDGKLDNKADK
jgi:hypothetical protein